MKPFLYLRSCTRFVLALGLLLSGPLGLAAPAKPPHPTRPTSPPARAARPSTLDPVAYYPFYGNANDGSGNGLHGTINGATLTTDRFGTANRAMHFDGNDNITFSGVPTTQTDNWTIATWVKLSNLTQEEGVFVFNGFDNGSVGDGYGVLCKNGGPFGSQLFGLAGGVSYYNSGYSFSSTNTWYFVVMARSAGVTRFYVNGVQTSQTSTDTPRTPTGFFIGSGANSRYFSGDLDEVRVYGRAISEAEIQSLYESPDGCSIPASLTGGGGPINVGTTLQLTGSPAGESHSYTSSNPNSATVSNTGLVTGISGGQATISYRVTDENGCSGVATQVVRVNRASGANFKILVVYAEFCGPTTAVQSALLAQPRVASADLFDGGVATPTLAQLQAYDIVVPIRNASYANPADLGDVLADYVDAGGAVVTFVFNYYSGSITGRWASGNYSPYSDFNATLQDGYSLGTYDATHPLMQGVSTLTSQYSQNPSPASGATSVAQKSDGSSLVAFRPVGGGHTTVGVAAYLGSCGSWSGDFPRLIVNAGTWLLDEAEDGCVTPTPPSITAGGPTTFCGEGGVLLSTGVFSSYSWKKNGTEVSTAPNYSATTSGSYTVTVTDGNGCVGTSAPVTVTINPQPSAPTVSGTLSICAGDTFLDFRFLTASGCNGSYLWSPGGQTSSSIIVTAGGEYSVTCTENGCTSPATTRTVTVNPRPTPVIQAFGPLTFCQPGFVGLGTTDTFSSYYWKKGDDGLSGNSSIAVGESGSYTVTVTDANGCRGTSTPVIVTVNPTPAAPGVSGTLSFCTGGSTTLTASGCTGSYAWSPNGETTAAITVNATGDYSVTCTENGCTSPATTRTVTEYPINASPSVNGTLSFCAGSSTTLTASGCNGYLWSPGGQTTAAITVTAAGEYSVTCTENGCPSLPTIRTVTVNPLPTPTISGGPLSFCPGGSVTLSTGSFSSFVWKKGTDPVSTSPTYSATTSGNYTVTVTDANGCVGTSAPVTVTVFPTPAPPVVSGSLSFCTGGSTTLTASGCNGSYAWSPGGSTTAALTVTAGGEYAVTCTENGCPSPATTRTVTVNPLPTPVISGGPLSFCAGGSVTLSTGSHSSYVWKKGADPVSTSPTYSATTSGSYTVTVTDANGCVGTSAPVSVTVNPLPTPTISGGPLSFCPGGSVTLSTGSFSGFVWKKGSDPVGTSPTYSATTSGSYTVTVTDANGCVGTSAPVTVTVFPTPAPPVVSGSLSFCTGGSTTLTASGCNGSYAWSPGGSTTAALTVTAGGEYAVTCTENGCPSPATTRTVTVNPLPTPSISAGGPLSFCAGGSVTLSTGSFSSFVWKKDGIPVSTSPTYSATASGSYTVTVTDANGCVGTSSPVIVTVNPLPTVSFSGLAPSYLLTDPAATLTGNPTGGSFSGPGISGNTFTPSAAEPGSHTILYQFTDGNGCSASASRSTTVTDQVTFVGDPTVGGAPVCAGQTITLTFSALNAANATFTAQLSNASGDFTTPLMSWTVSPGTTTLTIPGNTPSGTGYQIRVRSNAPVVTSNPSNVFRVNGLAFSSTPTVSQVPGCAGGTFRVSFTLNANCGYLPGNAFHVELSSASGSFASATSLGAVSPGISTVNVPTSVPAGTGYRVRIVSTNPAQISGVSSAFTINVPGFASTPTVSLDNRCPGEAVRLSFSVNGCAFFAGNTFTAQLSNASGVFAASPLSLGLVTPGGLNNVVIPVGTPPGTGYKIRVVSSNPVVTSAVSGNFKVKACNTREAAPEESGLRVTVSPNPSPEGKLRIVITGAESQSVRVALFNGSGQPVREQTLDRARQEETLNWDLARQPGGLYLLRVSAGREVRTVKVLR